VPATRPTLSAESDWRPGGGGWVAGVDEVGRGAWAGPLSVAVAVVPDDLAALPEGVADSKLLAEPVRERLWEPVGQWCAAWGVGHASPEECDELRMAAALVLATGRALAQLPQRFWPSVVLVDGGVDFVTPACAGLARLPLAGCQAPGDPRRGGTISKAGDLPGLPTVHTVVHGDATCGSIAVASILAKVVRDRIMRAEAPSFPPFDFGQNKGYPSPTHRRALLGYGLTSIHRRSWSYAAKLPWGAGVRGDLGPPGA